MNHSFITAVMPFAAGRAEGVRTLLDAMGNPAVRDIRERLDGTNCIHFMGIHVVAGDGERAYLMVDASADGGDDSALASLEAAIGPELQALMLAAGIDMEGRSVARMLALHGIKVSNAWFRTPGIDFDGSPRMSVRRIRDEASLARRITELLETPPGSNSALARLQDVRKVLWDDDWNKWAFFAEPAPFLLGVPPAKPLELKPILAALYAMAQRPLSVALPLGGLTGLFCGPDWGAGVGVLLFALGLFVQGRPSPDQVTASVIWQSVELMFWPLLVAVAVVTGLIWWLAGVGWAAIAAPVTSAIAFGLAYAVYLILGRKEKQDVPVDLPPTTDAIASMMVRESFTAQNLLAAASTVKPGFIRGITLRFGLAAADIAARYYSQPGFLTDIGVIHFARWFRLPGTDKLMFFSNYDGAWESYLEDFIERGFRGVTGIWSNTVGFPRTRGLLNGGARDGDRLRRWTRRQMFPVRFWYTAYPTLTLARIRINARIREGLATAHTEDAARKWLGLFGSMPEATAPSSGTDRPRLTQPRGRPVEAVAQPAEGIEVEDVPTPLFGALSHLPCSTVLFVRFGYQEGRDWLRHVRQHVTYGASRDASTAMVLGLTNTGLQRLGLRPEELATFPVPFQQGNHAPWRARAIGDVGYNSPDKWKWGGPANSVDAVLVVYAEDEQLLLERVEARIRDIQLYGHTLATRVRLKDVPSGPTPPAEAFGYVDGVSQPLIRGIRREVPGDQLHQVVAPGEFILGYRDHQGFVPPSPTVPAASDHNRLLPDAPLTAGWPLGADRPPKPEDRRDLGRNGTFMVIRQLEQDVDKFEKFLTTEAGRLASDPRVPTSGTPTVKDWLGAKIVGRWKDGSSLTGNPNAPATGSGGQPLDNNFTYGPDDVDGGRCPLGAHIRRANPRDSFDPSKDGAPVQLAITNRHRILRVGRSYSGGTDEKPGLMFMCLNVDIERQFEFIQQTWLLAPSFHGLECERDAMLSGRDPAANHFTIPTPGGPLRLPCMSDFIKVLGGAYFFLPGRRALQYLTQE